MIRVKYQIEMHDRVKVDLLFTLSMYEIARQKGLSIEIDDTDNHTQIIEFYNKIIYLAALNAWEVKLFDDPSMGDFPYKYIDFVEWAQQNQHEFGKMISAAALAIAGDTKADEKGIKKK